MGYVLNIVRTGVLPAITGGWYYDPDLNRFTNVFHIYLWLLYVLLPLVLFVSLPLTYGYGALYVTLVGITLGLIKLTNYRLHLTFNANLPDEPPNQESTGAAAPSAEADDASSPTTRSNHDNNAEVSHRAQESARPHNSVVSQVTEVIDDNDLTAAGCTASSLEAVSENGPSGDTNRAPNNEQLHPRTCETDDVSPIQGVSIACAAEESPPQAAASRSTEAVESDNSSRGIRGLSQSAGGGEEEATAAASSLQPPLPPLPPDNLSADSNASFSTACAVEGVAVKSAALVTNESTGPENAVIRQLSRDEDEARHLATSHNDTSDGAVHHFTDEDGLLHMYTFGPDGMTDVIVGADTLRNALQESGFGSHDPSRDTSYPSDVSPSLRHGYNPPPNPYVSSNLEHTRRRPRSTQVAITKPVHHFHPIPGLAYAVPLCFDRLKLMHLLDRDGSAREVVIGVFLAMLSAALGYALLASGYYTDFSVFVMCFIIGSAHYSLLKSVQPDPASPSQDERWTSLSRAIYLSIVAAVILILDATAKSTQSVVTLYGINFHSSSILQTGSSVLQIFLLVFPAVFTLGLLPQFYIFVLYSLEQIDLHVLGGNGTSGLVAAVVVNIRSAFVFGICYGFVYAAGTASEPGKDITTLWFSAAVALLVALCYHQSRVTSDPAILWMLAKNCFKSIPDAPTDKLNPYPQQLQETVVARLGSDLIVCTATLVIMFVLHVTTVFTVSELLWALCIGAAVLGFTMHYLVPQLRKHEPWLCAGNPVLRSKEFNQFNVTHAAHVTWFEKAELFARLVERDVLYPLLFASAATVSAPDLFEKFGVAGGAVVICICGIRMVRGSFTDVSFHYVIVAFAALFFQYDFKDRSETFLVDFFFAALIIRKSRELFQKLKFVLTYIAPWQQVWGSPAHVALQPLSVPHSGMLFLQSMISAFFSTPLTPFVGSAVFLNSYVRPIKFWEREYSTRRVDSSNTRLSSQLHQDPGSDDNNLNSLFYEHLTRCLRQSLCGDLSLGRWGRTYSGDFFVLASDSLNALVHIVEVGNGHVTFQLRGLEFRGTYCQQREVEAINEDKLDDNCCCFHPGRPPGMISVNKMFKQRWLAWEVTTRAFLLEGYSITANGASSMLNEYDMRKILVSYYVKSIIFYTIRLEKIFDMLQDERIDASLFQAHPPGSNYVDFDLAFNGRIDEDYDFISGAVSVSKFYQRFGDFLRNCAHNRDPSLECDARSKLLVLCFALSLLGRRVLNTAANNDALTIGSFLYGLHAMFKGDLRVESQKDEWVFTHIDILHQVIKPAVRMALKLHQDYFYASDEYADSDTLRTTIEEYDTSMVIAHESDPAWRDAVLDNVPSLLALRHVDEPGMRDSEYKIVMLNKTFLSFRVIKVNEECVRGLWAGQQYELVFLRNTNAERGSIQNARQALRNIINSSCDIGYPIYVSPLTTSYLESNSQVTGILGPSLSFSYIASKVRQCCQYAWCRITGSHGEPDAPRVAQGDGPASSVVAPGPTDSTSPPGPGHNRRPAPPTRTTPVSVFAAPNTSPPHRHTSAAATTSGGAAETSQTGSSVGVPWTASIGGGEEGSTASVGFRLAHGSVDSLHALSSAMNVDRESHVSSFQDGTKSMSAGRDNARGTSVAGGDEMASIGGISISGTSMAGLSGVSQVANAGSLAFSTQGAPSVGDSASHMDSVSRADASSRVDTQSRLDSQSVAETASRSETCRRRASSRSASVHSVGLSVAASSDVAAVSLAVSMDAPSAADATSLSNASNLEVSSRVDTIESTSRAPASLTGSGSIRSDRWSTTVSDVAAAGSIAGGYSGAGDSMIGNSGSIGLPDGVSTQANHSVTGGSLTGSMASLDTSRSGTTQLGKGEHEVDFSDVQPETPLASILESKAHNQFRVLRVELVFKNISTSKPAGLDIRWPDESLRVRCSPAYWQSKGWWPSKGVVGRLVHIWLPTKESDAPQERFHKLPGFGAILVLQCEEVACCVAIDQTAVADLGALC